MVDQVETPLADFAKKYVPWAGDIVALWFPPAGVFAKLIANAPLSDFENISAIERAVGAFRSWEPRRPLMQSPPRRLK